MTKVAIIYPADPLGVIPGGIDTFIRGILRWSPNDIDISLIGVTTDTKVRPIGKWIECDAGRRTYRFFAVAHYDNPASRSRIPLSIRFMLGLIKHRPTIVADVLEFHRIEPSLFFYLDKRPKNAFFHQNMQVLHNKSSDILWSKIPWLYFWVQDKLMSKLTNVYAVRRDAVDWYRERYKDSQNKFKFIPTWYDPETFFTIGSVSRESLRNELGMPQKIYALITVGRLDVQKDPLLLARAFKFLISKRDRIHLYYIGDGILREELEQYISMSGLENKISLLGLKSSAEIVKYLQASDLFVLSSAYEGMPMCVLEALGTGCPVVTTNVGEVRLVVKTGVNGEIIGDFNPETLSQAIDNALDNLDKYTGLPCTDAVRNYIPSKVLEPVYEQYRRLAKLS